MKAYSLTFFIPILILFSALTGCSSKETVRQALQEHPEWILDALEKNPEKFLTTLESTTRRAREIAMAKQRDEEASRRAEEWKNPKTPVIEPNRAVRGNKAAPVMIVAYTDFQCPYCKRGASTLEEVMQKYGDKVSFVLKHLPLDFHPQALPAAKYFEAIAMESGAKAYQFHDYVFQNQEQLGEKREKFLDEAAKKVGANMAQLKKNLNSAAITERLGADKKEAQQFGIFGTPGFIVGGISLPGAYPATSFQEIIDRRLSERGVASTPNP